MVSRIAAAVMGSCLLVACTVTTGDGGADGGGGSSGGGSGGGGSSGGGTTAGQAASDRATGYCAKLDACAPELLQRRFGDTTTCVSRYTTFYANALAAPSTGVTPDTEEACTAAYSSWACGDFLDAVNVPPACLQRTGSVATGGACEFFGQCQSGFCAVAAGTVCGVCAAAPSAGDSCASQACGQGLVCTTDTQTCAALGGQGQSCGAGAPCGNYFYCVGANAAQGVTGTCQQAIAQSGASCDATASTGPGCDHTQLLTCNTQTSQCATMSLAAGGQPCGTNDVDAQTVYCSAGGSCIGASAGAPGTCLAPAADGEACDRANGPYCMDPSVCVVSGGTAGTCQMPDASSCQ